jgi:hypothetical protein
MIEKNIAISFWIGVGILGLTFIAVIGGYN